MKNLFTCLIVCLSSFSFAQEAFIINDYKILVDVLENGECQVTETISVRFSEKRHGIIREIPLEGRFKKHRQKLTISDVSVKGHKYSVFKSNGNYNIRIGDKRTLVDGDQKYVINYKARNGILNFENHEEFYWTLIGPQWKTEILNADFTILLPKPIDFKDSDIQLFSGKAGKKTNFGEIKQVTNKTIKGKALSILGNGKGLTMGLRFPKGYYFQEPGSEKATELNENPGRKKDMALPIPILMLLGLFGAFRKWGRNPSDPPDYKHQYYPPEEMSSSEVGAFFDNKVNNRDLISLIPKWGNEAIIKVKVVGDDEVYLLKQSDLPANTLSHEVYFFKELFKERDSVFVPDLQHDFYSEFGTAKSKLKEDLDEGLYDENAINIFHSYKIILLGVAGVILGILTMIILKQMFTGIALLIFGICCIVIYFLEPKKSERGSVIHDHLKSLYETLKNPDQTEVSNILSQDSKYLEKIFPFVVAFGLEESFAEHFSSLSSRPPNWYYYEDGRMFGYGDVHRDFNTKSMGQTMSTPPVASSGSSSFGGGGSVGGGFGGGGGSSW